MAKTYSRVKKGMVFWFDLSEVYQTQSQYKGFNNKIYSSHIQMGNRPYMVLSSEDSNSYYPVCTVAPITTDRSKPKLSTHVTYYYEGKLQTILLEQITTVDMMALGDYVCCVSDEVLEKVEMALKEQFSIRTSVMYSDEVTGNTLKYLEEVVSNIIQQKSEDMNKSRQQINHKDLEDTALQLGQMIEDLFAIKNRVSSPNTVSESPQVTLEQTVEDKGEKDVEKDTEITPEKLKSFINKRTTKNIRGKKKKRTYNRWTYERRKQFLEDYSNMTIEQMSEKYKISKSSVTRTYHSCKSFIAV